MQITNFHFQKYFLQRQNLLPLMDAYKKSERCLNRTDESKEDSLLLADESNKWIALRDFLGTRSDESTFERIGQEDEYLSFIDLFNNAGASIFSFNRNLIEMLCQTEVDGIPIETLRLPFTTQYFHLGDSDLIRDISGDYKLDGFYLNEYTIEDELKSWFTDSDPNEPKPFWFSGSDEEWPTYNKKGYERNLLARQRYEQFKENIDNFDYGEDTYTLLSILFTFTRKDDASRPLTGPEILTEPTLRCFLEFKTHKTTIGEAIAYTFREGLPTETFSESAIFDKDESAKHKNTYLNIINKPEYLGFVVRLVFNLLAYLNWKDRDVVYRYPNEKFQSKIGRAFTEKERIRAISKTESTGFKKIYLCGHESAYLGNPYGNQGTSPRAHWRRGHWRNQRHGEGLADKMLVWIKPTLVNKAHGQLIKHIYVPGEK